MARTTRGVPRQSERALVSSTLTLAVLRLRKTWGLLLVTGLGIVAAVILACTVPLYAQVAMSAGLRDVLNASAQNADIVVRGSSTRISSSAIDKLTLQLNQEVQKQLGPYLGSSQFSLEQILSFSTTHERMGLVSASMDQAASHVRLMRGRLPQATRGTLEIAVTPRTASLLHLTYQATLGSVLKVNLDVIDANQNVSQKSLPLRIVGIFTLAQVDDPFWHGNDFESSQVKNEPILYRGLVASDAILPLMTHISDQAAAKGLFRDTAASVNWYYRFDPSHIAIAHLDDILNGVYSVKVDNANNANLEQSPFIDQTETYLPSDLLEQYRSRISVAQIPVAGLLILTLGLILFFVWLMIDLLVDRQSDALALLRSRGASQAQIFGSLVMQGLLLGLIALIVGPFLAVPLARFLVQYLLSPADQSVLNLLSNDPQIVWEVTELALVSVLVIFGAMVIALRQAVRLDALSIRREAARSTRRPFWQRLNFDIAAALLALIGYGFTYRHIPGVTSATLGYTTSSTAGDNLLSIPINFSAIDADTYAQTAVWTEQDSSQSLASLMAQLSTRRASAISQNVVPALVDAATWNVLHLTPGAYFRLNFSANDYADHLNFVALAEVQSIPASSNSVFSSVLVDFRSYAAVYAKISASTDGFAVPLTAVWLRTRDDPASLLSVREALNHGDLQLNPLYDRRAIIAALYHEPLYLGLIGVLLLGATTALLLALGGNLIASWLNVRGRLINFAVLRALGSTPSQITSILSWEQGIIYLVSLVLGSIFGTVFSAVAVPALVFTSVVPSGVGSDISSEQFYALQSVPPFHIVIPGALGLGLGLLIVICVVVLGMMVRVASRPSIGQALRLNED